MQTLQNKTAIVTGGASGIGKATALLLAQSGAAVAVLDIDAASGSDIVQQIQEQGGQAIFVRCDVTQADDCQRSVEQTVAKFGGLHILVNNAGIIRRTTVLDISEAEWDLVMAVNVKSIYLMSKFAIPHLESAGKGAIVNISSGWGLVGGRNAVSYCASKGAVVNLTRALALDHGAQNIRVNCICPGDTDTPMLRDEARQLAEDESAFLIEAADRPLKRVGTPRDIAQAVLYLSSESAAFVTGSVLVVDGGGLAG